MKHSFYLKQPKNKSETLILFTCHFKDEGKKFVYSTGEKIVPDNWDSNNRWPYRSGPKKSKQYGVIATQLNRYSEKFEEVQARCKIYKEDFTSKLLRREFDFEFKKVPSGKGLFFSTFDEFTSIKIKNQSWAPNTIKRYNNIKNLLEEFERERKFKLSFNRMNESFEAEFKDFSFKTKKHATNTYRRNIRLVKIFLRWALGKGYTYNQKFERFKEDKEVVTSRIALSMNQLEELMKIQFVNKKYERARDVFVFACTTGMRYGELKYLGEHNVSNDTIILKEEKSGSKEPRKIPLTNISRFILKKYNYQLPILANQKQNEYIKDIFKDAGYNKKVEKVTVRGIEKIRETVFEYQLISTHTARRTFITLMKERGVSDKLIANITGHKSINVLNQYYQVKESATKKALSDVFDSEISPLTKAN